MSDADGVFVDTSYAVVARPEVGAVAAAASGADILRTVQTQTDPFTFTTYMATEARYDTTSETPSFVTVRVRHGLDDTERLERAMHEPVSFEPEQVISFRCACARR